MSQRESCVTLRKTFRNHVNEAGEGSSAAKLFALKIFSCNCARLLNTASMQFNCVDEIQIEIGSERKTLVKGVYV